MSRSAKRWLIAGACLVVIGTITVAGVMTAVHWDLSSLGTDRFKTNTYTVSEAFSDVQLDTKTADIRFAPSNDGTCSVVCFEDEKMKHSVRVQDGTLTVSVADNRAWVDHIGFNFHSPEVTVYLPETEYASLAVEGSTGDLVIADKFRFDRVDISLSTGDVRIDALSADTLDLSASTGEILLSDVTCTGDLHASVTTGEVKMENVTCHDLVSNGSTGDISLKNVLASGKLSIERSTGEVEFDRTDAADIFAKTGTGDVTGSLLSEKVFVTDTSTGKISVPGTDAGGKCEIITSTGNINIRISDSADE